MCSFSAMALNARSLGTQQFGLLAVVQAYFAFLGGLATFDNWQPVVRLGLRAPKSLGLIIGSSLTLDLIACATAVLVAMTGLGLFLSLMDINHQAVLPIIVYGTSLLAGVGGTPKGYFRLEGRFDVLAMNQVAYNVLFLVAAAVLWYEGASLDTYFIVFAFVAAFPGVSLLCRMLLSMWTKGCAVRNPFSFASGRRFFRHFLRIAIGNSAISTLQTSRHQIALFIVSLMAGSAAAGLFAVGARCANAITRLVSPLNQVLFPEILRMAGEQDPMVLRDSMRRTVITLTALCAAVAAMGVIMSKYVVNLAAGSGYEAAADLFALLLTAEIALWLGYYFNPIILYAAGQTPLLKVNLTLMLLTVIVSVMFAHFLGALGVALALAIGGVGTFAALYKIASHSLRRSS